MNFNFDGKDYDSDKLSDKGKACLNKLQKNGVNFIPSSANTDYQAIQEWIADGGTYIYMAFAEQPLVGDNPATAR
jgi:hypothetical protein